MARLPRVIVLVGLPGSGKSTWAARNELPVLSSDAVRLLLAGDETNQTIHKRVFAAIRYLLRQRIAIGCPVTCIDATHLAPWERRPYFRIPNCRVEAAFFDVSVEECKRRNRRRRRVVPDAVIDRMADKLVPPARSEGFVRIRVIRGASRGRRLPPRPVR